MHRLYSRRFGLVIHVLLETYYSWHHRTVLLIAIVIQFHWHGNYSTWCTVDWVNSKEFCNIKKVSLAKLFQFSIVNFNWQYVAKITFDKPSSILPISSRSKVLFGYDCTPKIFVRFALIGLKQLITDLFDCGPPSWQLNFLLNRFEYFRQSLNLVWKTTVKSRKKTHKF